MKAEMFTLLKTLLKQEQDFTPDIKNNPFLLLLRTIFMVNLLLVQTLIHHSILIITLNFSWKNQLLRPKIPTPLKYLAITTVIKLFSTSLSYLTPILMTNSLIPEVTTELPLSKNNNNNNRKKKNLLAEDSMLNKMILNM